jgi:hypothetical protein
MQPSAKIHSARPATAASPVSVTACDRSAVGALVVAERAGRGEFGDAGGGRQRPRHHPHCQCYHLPTARNLHRHRRRGADGGPNGKPELIYHDQWRLHRNLRPPRRTPRGGAVGMSVPRGIAHPHRNPRSRQLGHARRSDTRLPRLRRNILRPGTQPQRLG